jgi:mRNA interferase YafQ
MWTLFQTTQFRKDLRRIGNNKKKLLALKEILEELAETGKVSPRYKPHHLTGNYKDAMECHIESDFLLIWIDEEHLTIKLVRVGSHSELF